MPASTASADAQSKVVDSWLALESWQRFQLATDLSSLSAEETDRLLAALCSCWRRALRFCRPGQEEAGALRKSQDSGLTLHRCYVLAGSERNAMTHRSALASALSPHQGACPLPPRPRLTMKKPSMVWKMGWVKI